MEKKENGQVEVDRSRLDRIVDVLSFASVGSFEEALRQAKVVQPDEFGVLEEALRLVITELCEARERTEAAVRALETTNATLEEKLSTIETQRNAIRELSTPILEVGSGIVALPVVGTIDASRAVEMTERLLQRIVDGGVRCAVVDLTGVEVVDSMTAQHLLEMVRATRMLGCFSVITGVGPSIARTLVELDLTFGEVPTLRSLKNGLDACLKHLAKGSSLAR
jgi:rsbT co-antagonist protein RsbR